MTSDFIQTAVSMSAKRELTVPIADLETFEGVITSLMNDETIGLTKKEAGSTSYTSKFTYFDADGNEKCRISFYAEDRTTYDAGLIYLEGDTVAAELAGADGSAVMDNTKSLWNVRISCAVSDDTFTISLNRNSITISGYAKPETLAAVETWADTVAALA